jgi:DNA polymerase III delta prime subunit
VTADRRTEDADKPSGSVTIGTIIGGIHNSIIAGRDIIIQIFTGDTAQRRAQRNRRAMLEIVNNIWIKGVLEKSLYSEVLIELGLDERPNAVERPWDTAMQMPNCPRRTLPSGVKMVQVFDELNGALLILGEPGSGKTTMLLELARDLIARAEQDPTQPIPIVFNLSSWTDKQVIADWLVDELIAKYNVPPKVARSWVENGELLPLLDGLDEAKPKSREACVRAINDFHAGHGLMPLVVCSRVTDYEALTTRLRLQGAVLLQPLTSGQVDGYFERAGTKLVAVRRALKYDTALQELAQSPLMLSIMTLAYRGMPTAAIVDQQVGSIEARRKHLFNTYTQQMLNRVGRSKRELYPQEQTMRWLTWLAQKMIEHEQSMFLLERIRRSWLPTRAQQRLHKVVSILVLGLVFALVLGLVFGLARGLISGLVFGLGWGLFSGSLEAEELTEVLKWSRKKVREGLFSMLVLGLVLGLMGAMRVGLVWGLVLGLVFGLVTGPVFGLVVGLEGAEMEMRTAPGQGTLQSTKNTIITMSIFGLVGGLLGRLFGGLTAGLLFGLLAGLCSGLQYGGQAVINHYTLRFVLCCDGHTPWSYVHFLDYAAELILLRKVGGGYIFVHRLLMEHFAALEPGQMKEPLGEGT